MSSLRPSRLRTPAAGVSGADPSLEDAMGLSPTAVSGKGSSARSPEGGIWREKNNSNKNAARKSPSVSTGTADAKAEKEGEGAGAESRQCLSPRQISSRNLSDGVNLDLPFDEAAHGGKQPTSLPSAVRSGLKLGNEIKSMDEATFEEDEEEARDDPDMLEGDESAASTLAVSVDTYLDEVKAPKEGEEAAAAATTSPRKKKNSNKKKGRKGKGKKKGGKSKGFAAAAAGGAAPNGLTAANLDGFNKAPSDEEVDEAYFSLSKSLSGFSSVTGASDLDADDTAAAVAATTTPKQGTSAPINSQAALRLSLWRGRDTVILSQTSPTKSRAATAATAAADVIVTNQKRAGAGGPESMRPKSQGELLLPSLCSGAASAQDESAVEQASSTVSSIMARGTATPRGHKSSSKYTFEAASNDGGVKKEVSFTQVRDAMRRFLSTSPKADQGSTANDAALSSSAAKEPLPSELQAAFWSKCAVLAATAVMATAKTSNNRVQIAQAAAETVLSKCPKGESAAPTDEDWRIAAAEGMEDLAAEVSSAIIAVGSQGGDIPTATTAAASAAAVVLLNQKEALRVPTAKSPTEKVAAAVANAAPSVIHEVPKPVVHAPTPVEEEKATEEPKDNSEEAPKRAVEEDMIESWRKRAVKEDTIESWRKEDNNEESELLSVGDAEAVVTPAPSVENNDVDTEDTPAASAATTTSGDGEEKVEENPTTEEKDLSEIEKEAEATTEEKEAEATTEEKEAEATTEEKDPSETEKEAEAPPAPAADEEWINIDKALPESTEAPAEEKTLGSKIALAVATASVAAASVAASAASSAAATTVEACCSPTEATSTKEAAVEVEASTEAKEEAVEVANNTATDAEVQTAPEDETLGSKIVLSIVTASAAAAATAIACCSPTEAVSAEKTENAEIETKTIPILAIDTEEKTASVEEKPATEEATAVEVSEDTKEATSSVEEAKENAPNSKPVEEVETSEAKEEVEIEVNAQDEVSETTEPSSNAAKVAIESDASQAAAAEKPAEEEEKPNVEEKESTDEPPSTNEASEKSKNTQLLEDLDNKQKERNAKLEKLRDFEAYLASVTSCASNDEEAAITCDTIKEEGEKNLVAESEDVSKNESIDATADETIVAESDTLSEPKPVSVDAEAIIISSGSEGETEASLTGSDTATQQNATVDEPTTESEKLADNIETETPTSDDTTSSLKSNDTEVEKDIGGVVSAEKTLTSAGVEETAICDTLEEAPTTDEGCHVHFSNTVREGLEDFAAAVVASCLPAPDVTGDDNKSKDSNEEEAKETAEEEGKESDKEIEQPNEDVATEKESEESEEGKEEPVVTEQEVLKPESVDEVSPAAEASADPKVGERLADIDESSVESSKEEEKKEENDPAESIMIVDEAAQLPVAKEAAIEAEADAVQPTPSKKSAAGKKKFSSVKKIFKKKGKKYEL